MKVEKIIHYLLIGSLTSRKIIYEMTNTTDAKAIYDINQIFNSYSKLHNHRPENTKVESYYMTITPGRIIMIIQTDESFPFKQNFELFKKIKNDVQELSEMNLNNNLAHHKMNLGPKITQSIYDFFNELNSEQILNVGSFRRNDTRLSKIMTNNYYNEEQMNMRIRNSLIKNNISFDADKFSLTQMIPDRTKGSNRSNNSINEKMSLYEQNNYKKSKKINVKIIDDNNEPDKSNISKSVNKYLIQSNLIAKNFNKNSTQSPRVPYALLRELQNIIWNITCCKKVIFFFLIFIIICQIIIIPIIIHYSYSY